MEIKIDLVFFRKEAIRQALYLRENDFHIDISHHEGIAKIKLDPKGDVDLSNLEQEIKNDILDYQVRLDVEERFKPIREEIVKKAFSPIEG